MSLARERSTFQHGIPFSNAELGTRSAELPFAYLAWFAVQPQRTRIFGLNFLISLSAA